MAALQLLSRGLEQRAVGQVLRQSRTLSSACTKNALQDGKGSNQWTSTLLTTRPSAALEAKAFSTSVALRAAKLCTSLTEALEDVEDGMTIMAGGFGMCGIPENLIQGLVKKDLKNLRVISNDFGVDDFGLGLLLRQRQVRKVIASYIGENKTLCRMYMQGELAVELVPQGTLAERIRAGGAGVAGFFTNTGYGTLVQQGNFPLRYSPDGSVLQSSAGREVRQFQGRNYVLEEGLRGDVALVKAWKADKMGNLTFRKAARNFNPTVARACKMTLAEVEEVVEVGRIQPEDVHLPHIYVDKVFHGGTYQKRISKLRFSNVQTEMEDPKDERIREMIARRVAIEFKDRMYINLGIGIPTMASNYVAPGITVYLMSENGLLGLGPYPKKGEEDADLINAGKETVTLMPGGSYFSSDDSFAMIRGNHLDLTVLGGMQVSRFGDLANYMIPGQRVMGMGGAMDLVAANQTRCIVTMQHCSKDGKPKIVDECSLPRTGKECVNVIITEKAVFDVDRKEGLLLKEVADGENVDSIRKITGCEFKVCPDLRRMQQSMYSPSNPAPPGVFPML